MIGFVVANNAKQSRVECTIFWIASSHTLLAMTRGDLNLQHPPHHRHAAAADRQARDLAILFLGAGLEQARPAHVDALADAKRKLQVGLGPQTLRHSGCPMRHPRERRPAARTCVATIVNIKQDADHPLGRQVLGEHFGARPCVRQRRTRRCTADDWRF